MRNKTRSIQIIEILSILLFYALLLIRKYLNRSVFKKREKKRMISGRVDKLMCSCQSAAVVHQIFGAVPITNISHRSSANFSRRNEKDG